VYEIKWDVGCHTSFSGKICDTLWTGINYGMKTIQFFLGSPQGYKRAQISSQDVIECKKILKRFPTSIFSHFPYIANLAGAKGCLAWNGDFLQNKKTTIILEALEYELGVLSSFYPNKNGVVIHPGNFPDRQKGLKTISKSINKINFPVNSKLLLENTAGQGTSLATTFEEIKTIIDGVDEKKRGNIGVCIDTCHIYAYGDYDLSLVDEVKRMFSDFDTIIGLDKFSLLHLNDSEKPMKSRIDRHACLGTGLIWKEDFSSLIYLLDECQKNNIPVVLETHGTDMITLSCLCNHEE